MTVRPAHVVVLLAGLIVAGSCENKSSPTQPTPQCTATLSAAGGTFASDGGSASVTVTTPAGCAWTAVASGGWITVTGGATGNGPGTVTYAVTANAATDARSGSLTIAGQGYTITQQGRTPTACSYDLAPGSAEFSKDASTGTVTVTAPAGCAWTAVSTASWITFTSTATGSGNGSVTYAVARNNDSAERRGAIGVADRMFPVRQSGDSGSCQYSVAPVDVTPCMAGGSVTATLTTQPFCPWTATSNASWLNVSSATSGSGPGVINFTFSDNYDAPRQGIVMVRWPTPTAGQNIRVAQAGCRYAVTRNAFGFAAAGGSGTFDVFQESDPNTCGGPTQDRCVWTARSDVSWIRVTTSMPRSGDNPVTFLVATNDGTAARTGTITVRDKVVTITQAGR
jgi:Viral BACON domain/Putative binding domain, N-terminal